MTDPKVDITVALEVEEEWPIADVSYDGDHWASVSYDGQDLSVTIYGQSSRNNPVPVDSAIESLQAAKQQILDIVGHGERAG